MSTFIEWNDKEWIKLVQQATDDACEEGAKMVLKDAKRLVPKKTGELSSRIKIRDAPYEDGGWSVFAQGPGDYDRFYAIFVELGTSDTKAQPFLRPALNKNKRKILKNFRDKIG